MKCIYWSLVMCQKHSTRAMGELREIGKAPSGAPPVLPHPPEAFDGVEVVPTTGREAREAQLVVVVVAGGVELVRPMAPAAIDAHHDLFLGFPAGGPDWVTIVAQLLRLKMRDALREDLRSALWDGAADAEQHAAGDAAPRAILSPCRAFAAFFACALALAQGTWQETRAVGLPPPAGAWQGKAPQDGCVCIEQKALPTASRVLDGGQFQSPRREVSGGRLEPSGGTTGAYVGFFHTSRTLARLTCTPVWRAQTVVSA